jgi:uroporphyrinogen-III decarboxylase
MDNETLYQERLDRIEKTINLDPVDRMPIIYAGLATAPRQMGVPIAEYLSDQDLAIDLTLKYMDNLGGLDGANSYPSTIINVELTLLWLNRILVPGRDLPNDSIWQVEEKEVMTVEDYDFIINEGFEAFQNHHLPKVIDMGELQQAIQMMPEISHKIITGFRKHGYVPMTGGVSTIPFEILCGARSMTQFYMDLYRRPDKVKSAMDVMIRSQIEAACEMAEVSGVNRIWVGGWRSASGLIAPNLWDRFVFPYFKEMTWALAEKGVVSILHFDQDWTRDLERLLDFPPRKCILNIDGMTDIREAKKILGGHMAIMGDIPSALLKTGTPDDVYNYVRELIHDIGPTGFLLAPGCEAPIDAKAENMVAYVAAGHDFGVHV